MSNVIDVVTEIVTPFLEEHDFELVEIEFVKEGKSQFLRVYIDKKDSIDIDECVLVSEYLSEKLDALDPDPIPEAYFLEVSSPGAERPLKKEADFKRAVNKYIHLSFYQAVNGAKQMEGTLKSFDKETLTLIVRFKTREKEITIKRTNIAKARLAIQF